MQVKGEDACLHPRVAFIAAAFRATLGRNAVNLTAERMTEANERLGNIKAKRYEKRGIVTQGGKRREHYRGREKGESEIA